MTTVVGVPIDLPKGFIWKLPRFLNWDNEMRHQQYVKYSTTVNGKGIIYDHFIGEGSTLEMVVVQMSYVSLPYPNDFFLSFV